MLGQGYSVKYRKNKDGYPRTAALVIKITKGFS